MFHRKCLEYEALLLRDRDQLESHLLRLRKQHEDLQAAYQSLAEQAIIQFRPADIAQHLFEEVPQGKDRDPGFLTPTWEDREGEVEAGA